MRLDRLSLRTRLVASLLALLAVALAVTGVAASAVLRDYLAGRVDDEMVRTSAVLERGLDRGFGPGGPGGFPGGETPGPEAHGPLGRQPLPSRYLLRVVDADGTTAAELGDPLVTGEQPAFTGLDAAAAERAGEPYTVDADDGTPWRVLLRPLDEGRTLVLATPFEDVEATTTRLRRVTLAVDVVVLAGVALVGLAAVRGSLRPLRRIEATAGAIAAGDLSRRVPEGAPGTEVGRLSAALNGMLGQIERAFAARTESEARMRRFVADASHELRTPLTSVRGYAELYRQGAVTDPDEVARLMRRIEDESARMAGLVEDLLLLARLDEQRPLRRDTVDLAVLAADAAYDARAVADGHTVALDVPAEDGVPVVGDEERLRQVLANLVTNALRHTPAGTRVTVRARRQDGDGVVEVTDDGPGMAPEAASQVFDRFYRADPSRSREGGGGSGLGLAIVAALVRAHGGDVEVETAPGSGATFRVRVPLAG